MEYLGISEEASVIHNKLSDFITNTTKFYDFGNLNPDKLFLEINDVIENNAEFDKEVDLKKVKKEIIIRIKEMIKENLKNQKNEVLSKFIDQFNDDNIHKTFNMLLYFLKQNGEFLSEEDCKMLLNVNDNFNKALQKWIKDYAHGDKAIPFELMYYNPNFITILKTYCFENNLSYTNILSKFSNNKKENEISIKDLHPVTSANFFQSISKVCLSKAQEKYLGYEVLAGNQEAKEEFVKHNILLTYSIAKKFYRGIIPFDDLLQSGNEGLLEAVNNYDASLGYAFSTYATWWIRQKIQRFLVTQLPVTVSQNAYDDLKEYNNALNTFYMENGYEPSLQQISEILGWSKERTYDINSILEQVVNLDTTSEISDVVIKNNKPNLNPFTSDVETIFDNIELRALVPKWFEKAGLSDIEKEVLSRHYGLSGEAETLDAIGQKHMVSRQRIDQIKTRAINKMKKVSEIEEYFEILGRETRKNSTARRG